MSEADPVLNRMEYQTYKIIKEQNDQYQLQSERIITEISESNNRLLQLKEEIQLIPQMLSQKEQEINNLQQEINNIRTEQDFEIYRLQNQLSLFEQRYLKQEEKNDVALHLEQFRNPNRYFCDIEKGLDNIISVKIVFIQGFKIQKIDADIINNQVDIVALLQNNDISHIVKHKIYVDQQNMRCLGKVVQGNQVTFQIGSAP
ncbi:unnamed protein product (macronuclear) [Paramecium tetraurelia]|uniref:Uncharacterized protein n=1 Tax=Paramecium tetraurelia TaxID=5888 RepID=A0BTP5_PARTE|nr:uncharacterized protein GSPATT00032144001 [Paramecium tetraurelia]CAK61912.1 unnamed protein product [Paramecium tetraurelia]|eukprot:XP_001429310.1 hypothetical protein (macronuclear) [Paramecium tetraurelia strain d4-2]